MVEDVVAGGAADSASQGKYQYRLRLLNSSLNGQRDAGGKLLSSSGGSCTWGSDDASPSVNGCKKYRRALGGYITEYGYRGKRLNQSQLHQCNGASGRHLYTLRIAGIYSDMVVERNGMKALCTRRGNSCTWLSDDSSPSAKGCRNWKNAVQGGDVSSYGYSGKRLSHSNLKKCNTS